jgi:predicted RNase H-like nuclease (RuvC/YqgF family)
MSDRAITDWEIAEERRHDASAVKHGEYDEETEKMMDKIEALERGFEELKKEIEALKVKL